MPSKKQNNHDGESKSKYVTVKNAMELTQLSETTLYRAIEDGRLHRFKVGRRTLLLREEVDALPRPA